jgi:predicted amidohydrolase
VTICGDLNCNLEVPVESLIVAYSLGRCETGGVDSLRLAVAQPRSILGDLVNNVAEHAVLVGSVEARVVVFPELSLTGYDMNVAPVAEDDPVLVPLVDTRRRANSIALVGAPTAGTFDGARRISMLRIDASGVSTVYSKIHLGGEEPGHYQPGESVAVVEIDGWRLGLAICKDNGQHEHVDRTVALGIDAYVAGVCEIEEDRGVQPVRAARVIADHRVWVAYASFAGSTGGGFDDTAGRSAVRDPAGVVRLQLGRNAGQSAWTTLTR